MQPVILDLDGSAGTLPQAHVLELRQLEQTLRFACSRADLRRFAARLHTHLPDAHGTVLLGSGDFHHLSLPLIERAARRHAPLQVVVLDNHPDNMRFAFGVHCGSWVQRVADLPGVAHVHVLGITSPDIGLAHAWENRLRPLYGGRLTYWSCGVDIRWAQRVGLGRAFRAFDSMGSLVQAFSAAIAGTRHMVYLSIDKDVLSPEDARTNWDQGCMREQQMLDVIGALHGRIVGSDITGEVSVAHYRQWWKRLLSALDDQPAIPPEDLARWQSAQQALNLRLLAAIDAAQASPPV